VLSGSAADPFSRPCASTATASTYLYLHLKPPQALLSHCAAGRVVPDSADPSMTRDAAPRALASHVASARRWSTSPPGRRGLSPRGSSARPAPPAAACPSHPWACPRPWACILIWRLQRRSRSVGQGIIADQRTW